MAPRKQVATGPHCCRSYHRSEETQLPNLPADNSEMASSSNKRRRRTLEVIPANIEELPSVSKKRKTKLGNTIKRKGILDLRTRETDKLCALMNIPSVLGGLPLSNMYQHCQRGCPDPLTIWLKIIGVIKRTSPKVYNCILHLIPCVVKADYDPVKLVEDIYSLNILGMPNFERKARELIEEFLPTYVTNPKVIRLLGADRSDLESLCNILTTMRPYVANLAHEILRNSNEGVQLQLIGSFSNLQTINRMINEDPTRTETIFSLGKLKDAEAIEVLRRRLKKSELPVTGIHLLEKALSSIPCTFKAAQWLRETTWGFPITGITSPVPCEQVKIEDYDSIDRSLKKDCIIVKTSYKLKTEGKGALRSRGPFEPYLGHPSAALSAKSTGQVLLGTALVKIIDPENNNTYIARAVLDGGSQSCLMTVNLKKKMGLVSRDPDTLIISGINNMQVPISESCNIKISSLLTAFHTNLNCLVVPEVTGQLPNFPIDVVSLNLPNNIQFADPKFYNPADVDILLGADIFYDLLIPEQISLGVKKPILQNTKLGWILAGRSYYKPYNRIPHKIHCNFTKQISEDLAKFWALEELPSSKFSATTDEQFCEEHFLKNTKRLPSGRFSVLMPLTEIPETALGDSYNMAAKRFYNLEKKLNKDPELKEMYCKFIHEYEALDHLTKIDKPKFGNYIPHFAIFREGSETTKLRVVFDAAAKTSSKKSLNDIQCIGPVVQDDLFNILIRFRQHKFVLTGDIQKMYRQIEIQEPQRNLQLILWRDNDSKPLEVLRLNTVTYGTASAPFLSTRCLLQLSHECSDPIIAEIIKRDFYMDDLLTGADSQAELAYILKNVVDQLDSSCFPLHKFRTNCTQIFSESTNTNPLDLDKKSSVLGVSWSPETDTLNFSININDNTNKITKRIILSETCKIFDPLGLLSACTITLKVLLQKLWLQNLTWDESVPEDIKKIWLKTSRNLHALHSVSIPRHILPTTYTTCELHCFVDASQDAYAACVYVRAVNNDYVTVSLLCAKTRVAPIKTLTIPRLELSAALLGARLVAKVSEALRCPINKKLFWSDSTVTLGWIKTQTKNLKTFVCNRVNEIHELTDRDSWRHVPTNLNPADMASRGVDPGYLINCSMWWEGPDYLKNTEESQWPEIPNTKIILPELKALPTLTKLKNEENSEFIYLYSTINSEH
ncbi:unnamed protein product [Colias eurytheme]|nr:unnamed protein product [Colias eurytheme]